MSWKGAFCFTGCNAEKKDEKPVGCCITKQIWYVLIHCLFVCFVRVCVCFFFFLERERDSVCVFVCVCLHECIVVLFSRSDFLF